MTRPVNERGFSSAGIPPAGSVGTSQIADGAVTEPKIDPAYRSMFDPLSTFPSYGTTRGAFEGQWCTDFIGTGFGASPYTIISSGVAAAAADASGTALRPGILEFQTGTDAAGRTGLRSSTPCVLFGGGSWRYRADINIPTASDGVNTFIGYGGFIDSVGGEPADGAYFRYQHTENAGNWTCVCRSNNVETTADSGVSAVHATAYRALEIEVNAAASSVVFYVDGALVATIATNIPTGAGRETGIGANNRKTLGGTSRSMFIDLMGARFAGTAGR